MQRWTNRPAKQNKNRYKVLTPHRTSCLPVAALQIREEITDYSIHDAETTGEAENPIQLQRKNEIVFFPQAMQKLHSKHIKKS